MPATPLPVAQRFVALENTKIYFLPTVAGFLTPAVTRAEINGGTDMTGEVVDWSGWSSKTNFFESPTLASRFQPKMADTESAEDSSLTFAADKSGDDIRTVLERGDTGFVLFADGGDVVAYLADIYAVEVASTTFVRAFKGTEARIRVDFSLTRVPALNVALPAVA